MRSQRLGLEQVGAHYAISSTFETYAEGTPLFCFDIRRKEFEVFSSGRGRIAIGQAEISSRITEEREPVDFAVLHLGDQNLSAAVRRSNSDDPGAFTTFAQEVRAAVERADLPEVIRKFDRFFGDTAYSLSSLFRDEQRRILQGILDSTLDEMEGHLRILYENHVSLLHFLSTTGMPKPQALMLAAEFVLNADLRHVLEKEPLDAERLRERLTLATTDEVPLHGSELGFISSQRLKHAMDGLQQAPGNMAILESVLELTSVLTQMPFEINLWHAQNIWNTMLHSPATIMQEAEWMEKFMELGRHLDLQVEDLIVEA